MVAAPPPGPHHHDGTAEFSPARLASIWETVLAAEQLVFRALGAAGVLLIARGWGFALRPAWWIAATVLPGRHHRRTHVLTVEYDPIRRIRHRADPAGHGLAAHRRYLWAGIAGLVAFLFRHHDSAVLDRRRVLLARHRQGREVLAPLAPGVWFSRPGSLPAAGRPIGISFHRLDPLREAILRTLAVRPFVSTWQPWHSWIMESKRHRTAGCLEGRVKALPRAARAPFSGHARCWAWPRFHSPGRCLDWAALGIRSVWQPAARGGLRDPRVADCGRRRGSARSHGAPVAAGHRLGWLWRSPGSEARPSGTAAFTWSRWPWRRSGHRSRWMGFGGAEVSKRRTRLAGLVPSFAMQTGLVEN